MLNKSSEILGLVLFRVLRKKSFFWLDIVSDWVLLADGFCSRVSIRVGKKIFADQALNMSGIARHLLIPNLMVWATDPIFREFAMITMDLLVFVDGRNKV